MLNETLLKVYRGEIDRLIITMPPRHSKSETVSKFFSSWWLGMRPEDRIILASYEDTFAATWGRKSRDLLEEFGPRFFDIQVNERSSAANRWDILGHDGGMNTAGVGGPITGKGANLFIIDDYLKNSEEARSDIIREKHWDWWTGTARTRLEPHAAVIIMATRWHEDDLIGRILANDESGDWNILALPAIAKYDELPHRKEGEALWPERYPLAELLRILHDITPFWFEAEYQCSPHPADGIIFKRSGVRYWQRYPEGFQLRMANGDDKLVPESKTWKFCTVDLAASERETADYTVVACWAVTPSNDIILVDLIRARLPGPDKIPAIKDMVARHQVQYVAVEKTGFQLDFVKNARNEGLPIVELDAKGDKVARSIEASVKWESGSFYVPANASWTHTFCEELYTFPNGAHDDCVDVTAYAALEAIKRGNPMMAYGLTECIGCHKKYTRTQRTGLDRPCPYCGKRPESDDANSFAVPV